MTPPLDPRMLEADANRPAKEASTSEVRALVTLAEEMRHAGEEVARLEADLAEAKARYDHFRKEELPEKMRKAGLVSASGKGSFTLPDGSSVYLQGDMHVHVPKEKQEEFHAWLRKEGNGDLIQDTVWWQTLRAFVKERIGGGLSLPSYVEAYPYLVARVRKPSK